MRERYDRVLRVLVTPSLLQRISAAAEGQGQTVSDWTREALEAHLARDPRLVERIKAKIAQFEALAAEDVPVRLEPTLTGTWKWAFSSRRLSIIRRMRASRSIGSAHRLRVAAQTSTIALTAALLTLQAPGANAPQFL